MLHYFYEGGTLFMSILSILLLFNLSLAAYFAMLLYSGKVSDPGKFRYRLSYIRSLGLLIMVVGILGQLIGLFDAFKAIEQMGGVSPAMLAGGLKVSMITTLYGVISFVISFLIWFILDWKNGKAVAN